MDIAETEAALRAAANRYHEANSARNSAMEELRRCIIAADQAGLTRTRIVEVADVARQTVYDALKAR